MPRTREAKDALFDAFSSVAKAMASGRRAEIIDVLAQGERSVEDIAAEIDQSVANTSHHLRLLARSGLLRSRRSGTHVFYRLASPRVAELWTALRDVAETHVAEVGVLAADLVGDRSDVEALHPDELARRIEAGRVVVLDVRPHVEFEAGHIAGARSVPIDELPDAVAGLPRSREIVAYCRGPYCVKADDAVRLLHEHGLRARRLDTGYPEWRHAGLPVETPDDHPG
ncbi:MAG: metalloregulator ArsR/SmtB family transcription factor [Acidimicrobiales bacterium]|jgi:rhodanese-related sulfurtransferase|nr:metalloregulator ArsR/SmtB family transcription factor [Acidimicrobiales bacterium]